MPVPGLSFEIIRASAPVLGLRADRTAMIALTRRGPRETPVLVHGWDEFVEQFGCAMDGALGALAARGYFDNGGEELLVARFAPAGALASTGSLASVGASTSPSFVLPLSARDPGSFGDDIEVEAILSLRRRAKASFGSVFTLADAGMPVHVVAPTHVPPIDVWGTVNGTGTGFAVGTGTAVTSGTTVLIEVYEPTFALQIREPLRADVVVPDLDLRDLDGSRKKLATSSVTIADSATGSHAELPVPGVRVRLQHGSDGLTGSVVDTLVDSFRQCIRALEPLDLPDIVIAPDLWSRIYATKGKTRLAFDAATAVGLADEMVQSAARTRDRVVIVDPPLAGPGEVRPATVSELRAWYQDREDALGDDRDFAATFDPWVRIVAGGVYRGDDTLLVPPSAYVAGRMARTSRQRGAWIATGNVALERVVGLSERLGVADQEALLDLGISPLRQEMPQGATIQGVRTLSWPDRKPWGFLSTRRLFNYLRRALRPLGLSYAFEPNDPTTWMALRRDIVRFLGDMYALGAFAGAQPADAFFVTIDDTLNPEDARDNGVMTAQIGVAPAVPLEFLLVRLVVQGGVATVAEEAA